MKKLAGICHWPNSNLLWLLKEEFVKMLLTSGYSTKVLAFLIKSSLESEVKVNLESGDNLSWIVKHPSLENVFYATHEVESGAVSRWKIDEEGKLNMLEVCNMLFFFIQYHKLFYSNLGNWQFIDSVIIIGLKIENDSCYNRLRLGVQAMSFQLVLWNIKDSQFEFEVCVSSPTQVFNWLK